MMAAKREVTPVREIGQWAGDSLIVGMEIAANVFSDLRPFIRTIRQAAICARQDGLVSSLPCGNPTYLPAYSLLWVDANIRYFELTGDDTLLRELFQAAIKNMSVFEKAWNQNNGLTLENGFVDWGFFINSPMINVILAQYYARALKNMVRWCEIINDNSKKKHFNNLLENTKKYLVDYLSHSLIDIKDDWAKIGATCR